MGDHRECLIVVWSTHDYVAIGKVTVNFPMHAIHWNPYSANEFVSVGRNRSVVFCYVSDALYQEGLQVSS